MKNIKTYVLATNSEGSPSILTFSLSVTKTQSDNGDHYDIAKEKAKDAGYDSPMMAFDQNDEAGQQIAKLKGL